MTSLELYRTGLLQTQKIVCLCVHVCVGLCAYAHTEARGRCQMPCVVMLHLIPLRQGLSLKLELGWQPASLSDPPVPLLK